MRAAFFDLDRTVISGSSSQVFGQMLAELGVVNQSVPGQDIFFKLYEWFGEDPLSMGLARQGSRLFAGRRLDDVQTAARMAAEILNRRVLPFARAEILDHKRNGTLTVLATTSPVDLVAPLADLIGFDAVLATRYRTVHGVYDGTVDGEFLHGEAKAAALTRWAAANQVDLSESAAYSDSWYDLPMLEAVGRPVAVNADARLRAAALLRRWEVRDFETSEPVTSIGGRELQDLLFPLFRPELSLLANIDLRGAENVPSKGGVILVSNHRSYFDPFALGYVAAARKRPVRFLAKKELFDVPLVGDLIGRMGVIPVDRGSGSKSPLNLAAKAVDGGEAVIILPEGTIPRGEAFFAPQLRGSTGAVRLSAMTGAPIVPIGIWGTERVWPRNSKLPRIEGLVERPDVVIVVGEPKAYPGDDPKAETEALMNTIVDLLPPEAREPYEPTEDELAATHPTS